jgi:hypothetical protein
LRVARVTLDPGVCAEAAYWLRALIFIVRRYSEGPRLQVRITIAAGVSQTFSLANAEVSIQKLLGMGASAEVFPVR